MTLFDYDQDGHSIVLGDGAELLVHDGATEGPRWRTDVGARLVGVASNAVCIISLDEKWVLGLWSHETATSVGRHELGVRATGLAADFVGKVAAVHDGGVVVIAAGKPHSIDVPGATAAAFSEDGLAIGTAAGEVHLFDAAHQPRGTATVPGRVNALAWHRDGFVFAAAEGSLHRIDGTKVSHVTNAPDGMDVQHVACTPNGDRVALQLGDKTVVVMEYPSRETAASVIYGDREVCGVAFGPGDWLGVGMHGGDGNKINLATGATHRTDTHPGREHNRWILMVDAGAPAVPVAAPASSASSSLSGDGVSGDGMAKWLGYGALLVIAVVAFLMMR